jgi:hypothetical protein
MIRIVVNFLAPRSDLAVRDENKHVLLDGENVSGCDYSMDLVDRGVRLCSRRFSDPSTIAGPEKG